MTVLMAIRTLVRHDVLHDMHRHDAHHDHMRPGVVGPHCGWISVTALAEKCGGGKVAQSKTCILYRLHAALARMIIVLT